MRKFILLAASVAGIMAAVEWWRRHPRIGTGSMNRTVNPWLVRHGLIGGSRGELGLIEHVGRKSGIVRRTPVHPVPTPDGFRIIVPVGTQSEWLRNILAAGHCRLIIGETVVALDEPVVESPREVPGLGRPARDIFEWLGFRYVSLHRLSEAPMSPAAEPTEERVAALA